MDQPDNASQGTDVGAEALPAPPAAGGKPRSSVATFVAVLLLLAWAWVLWVAGAIAYSYGLEVIAWATTR